MKKPEFTGIPNKILDVILLHDFSKRELKVMFAIARQTYGWHKEVDDIALSKLAKMTGIYPSHLCTSINSLTKRNIIIKKTGKHGQLLEINNCVNDWVFDSKKQVEKSKNGGKSITETVIEGVTKTVTLGVTETVTDYYRNSNAAITETVNTKETINRNYQKKKEREKKKPISLSDFLKERAEKGEKGIQPNDKIFDYGRAVGVSDEMLMTAWHKFKDYYIGKVDKKQKDWRAAFRNCVKDNWYEYWGIPANDDEPAYWTSKGKQKRREVKNFNHGFE